MRMFMIVESSEKCYVSRLWVVAAESLQQAKLLQLVPHDLDPHVTSTFELCSDARDFSTPALAWHMSGED